MIVACLFFFLKSHSMYYVKNKKHTQSSVKRFGVFLSKISSILLYYIARDLEKKRQATIIGSPVNSINTGTITPGKIPMFG